MLRGSRANERYYNKRIGARTSSFHQNIAGYTARGPDAHHRAQRSKLNFQENKMAGIWRNSRASKRDVRSSGEVGFCSNLRAGPACRRGVSWDRRFHAKLAPRELDARAILN